MARMTVLQSVFRAEGFTDRAHPGSVIVIRKDAQNRPFGIKVDLKRVMKGEEGARDIELQPYDIVYVPKKAIARVNVWVDQYIRRNIPVQTSLGLTYELNP
jgi:protein involved in polysaccharide export with SLBB domain